MSDTLGLYNIIHELRMAIPNLPAEVKSAATGALYAIERADTALALQDIASKISMNRQHVPEIVHAFSQGAQSGGGPVALAKFYEVLQDRGGISGGFSAQAKQRIGIRLADAVNEHLTSMTSISPPAERISEFVKNMKASLSHIGVDSANVADMAGDLKNKIWPALEANGFTNEARLAVDKAATAAAQEAFANAKASALKAIEEVKQAAEQKAEEFRLAAEQRAKAVKPPVSAPTPAPAAEAAANGGRKWFQMLTHSAEGHFSGARTGVTAAAVAAVAAGGIYLSTRNPKKDPDAKWVDQTRSTETAPSAHR